MGLHIGLIASKASVVDFCSVFSKCWPHLEIIAEQESFVDTASMWSWKESHEQFVSATDWTEENRGRSVYILWQDGPWAMMMDSSYTVASDEIGLRALSSAIGRTLSFVVETAGGFAYFASYEAGERVREIINNGSILTFGSPIPEEAGINVERFYLDEVEALWRALGISTEMPRLQGNRAICVIDHTDYRADD